MRMISALAVVLLLLQGCGGTGARYPMADADKTMNEFIEATREYYATRTDGKLAEPTIGGNKIRFIFTYNSIKNGRHGEEVVLDVFKEHADKSDRTRTVPAEWRVGAFYPIEGPDPEVIEVRDAITSGLLKRLDATAAKP